MCFPGTQRKSWVKVSQHLSWMRLPEKFATYVLFCVFPPISLWRMLNWLLALPLLIYGGHLCQAPWSRWDCPASDGPSVSFLPHIRAVFLYKIVLLIHRTITFIPPCTQTQNVGVLTVSHLELQASGGPIIRVPVHTACWDAHVQHDVTTGFCLYSCSVVPQLGFYSNVHNVIHLQNADSL